MIALSLYKNKKLKLVNKKISNKINPKDVELKFFIQVFVPLIFLGLSNQWRIDIH